MANNKIKSVSELDLSQLHNMVELNFHHNLLTQFNEGIGQMTKVICVQILQSSHL